MRRTGWMLWGVWFAVAPAAAEDVTPSIVKIEATYREPNWERPWEMRGIGRRSGSGCLLEGGRVLTNAHVVSDQTFLQVRRAGSPDKFVAEVEAVSHELDLALLRVTDEKFFQGAAPLALGDLPDIGDAVVAYGFPLGGTRVTITRGVVSRTDRQVYSHSSQRNLVCQIDAAINGGSSGGPVLDARNRIAGVAFQATGGQSIGYMIPAPVVRHFLEDIADGRLDGTPMLPWHFQPLENEALRRSLRLPDGRSGVVAQMAWLGSTVLRRHDVLLRIDGHDVGNDGTVALDGGRRVDLQYLVDRRQLGGSIDVEVLRDGKPLPLQLPLGVAKASYPHLMPRAQYETRPRYYIVGGLVFSPLTVNYCHTWESWDEVPVTLQRYWFEPRREENAWRKDVVVCVEVLPDRLNAGYAWVEDSVIESVNGKRIGGMKDLIEAIEKHEGKYHRIALEPSGFEVVLDREAAARVGPEILARYEVPADRSPDFR